VSRRLSGLRVKFACRQDDRPPFTGITRESIKNQPEQHEKMTYNMQRKPCTIVVPVKLFGNLALLLHGLLVAGSVAQDAENVQIHIRNDASLRLQIGWVDNQGETVHSIGILEPFGTASLNAFEEHEFEVRELPANGGRCEHLSELDHETGEALQEKEGCAITAFRAGDLEDQCTCYGWWE
jgi:hypothetical protein